MTIQTQDLPNPARARGHLPPLSRIAAYILIFLGAVLTIAPFYFMFVFATHTRDQIFQLPPPLWFGSHLQDNYQSLMERTPFWRNLWNSLYLAVLTTVTTMFFCTLGGFAFAMYQFKGRNFLFGLLLATMLIPGTLNIVPFALIMQGLGWIDQPRALWVPGMASAFGIFLMRQYIGSAIPRELVEAARIDGATEFGIFRKIILPLLTPALLAGLSLSFARSLGEFGAVIFIAGNIPFVSEIAPLLIVIKLSEFDYGGAAAIATIMLAISFLTLLLINLIQAWSRRRYVYGA